MAIRYRTELIDFHGSDRYPASERAPSVSDRHASTFASKMKAVIPVLTFLARHFLFVVFAMFAGCIIWTIAYFALLAIAVITDQRGGGPLAFPVGIITVLAACVFLGWGIFAPASATGAAFCGLFRLPRIAAIPVVCLAAFLLSYLIYWAFIELGTTHSMPSVLTVLKNFGIYLSVPLGIYWWLTEGPGALFDAFRRWIRRRRSDESISEQVAGRQDMTRSATEAP